MHVPIAQPTAIPSANTQPTLNLIHGLDPPLVPTAIQATSEPVTIPHSRNSNQDRTVEMISTDESSASSTPVSDTTATDTDSNVAPNIPS